MKYVEEPYTSHEDNQQNTSHQSSSSGTTGLGSFVVASVFKDYGMEDIRDELKTGSVCVDQGSDNLEPPQALYTPGGDIPRAGYEPKPSITWVVGGTTDQDLPDLPMSPVTEPDIDSDEYRHLCNGRGNLETAELSNTNVSWDFGAEISELDETSRT